MSIPDVGLPQQSDADAAAQIGAWLAGHCEAVPHTLGAVVVLGPADSGPFRPVAFWPVGQQGAPRLSDVAEMALEQRQGVTAPIEPDALGFAVPLELDGHLHGVLAFELAGGVDQEVKQETLQRLAEGLAWLVNWLRKSQPIPGLGAEERLMVALDAVGVVLEEESFASACRSLVTELATRLLCDRVSLGVVRAGHAKVVALSHSALTPGRVNLMHAVGAAMDEAIDQRTPIRYPAAPGDDAVVARDHARLANEHGASSVLTVPMSGARHWAGALVFERPASLPFDDADLELAQAVAAVLARILELKQLNERLLVFRAADAFLEQAGRLVGPRRVKRKLVVLALIGAAVFFSVAKGDYRVTAPATLEGSVRRTLAAPFDGYIASATARAGDNIRAGAVLASLDDRDIRLERLKWASQYAQFIKQHQEAVANRDRAKSQIAQAQYEQAQAQVALLDAQLRRAGVVAPFDGVIVKGDLSQSLGAAVKRGDSLFEVAPLGSFRLILNVDERDIADLATGQKGQLILSSLTQESFPFTVGNLTSVTTAREGRNFFRVEALIDQSAERLRPGMEGVAKVHVGEQLLIRNWTNRMVNWMRLTVWTFWP